MSSCAHKTRATRHSPWQKKIKPMTNPSQLDQQQHNDMCHACYDHYTLWCHCHCQHPKQFCLQQKNIVTTASTMQQQSSNAHYLRWSSPTAVLVTNCVSTICIINNCSHCSDYQQTCSSSKECVTAISGCVCTIWIGTVQWQYDDNTSVSCKYDLPPRLRIHAHGLHGKYVWQL